MGIARPVMETFPYAWAFFVPFILIATFTMLNLFVAIIVSAMQTYEQSDPKATVAVVEQARDHIETDLHTEVRALREEIAGLRQVLRERR
jgi:voltage-gated sodium channel